MIKQKQKGKARLDGISRYVDTPMLPSSRSVTHAPLDLIAMMTQVRVKDPFPCKTQSREPLGTYHVKTTIQRGEDSISSMIAK